MTRRRTVAQALVEFLSHQWTVDGEHRERTVPAVFGILGHGNLAGLGQALAEAAERDPAALPYRQARNEQAMVHQAVGYARMHRRRGTYAVTSSVGPGTTNLVTGAALATANRLPALLLVSDVFATAPADPVLQQLEHPYAPGLQAVDALAPVSRYFARISRPEQLYGAALSALRVLTDPAETGAVTLVLPQDVQTEALEVPDDFLSDRSWRLRRPPAEDELLDAAADAVRAARRPLIVAGGGVFYSGAETALRTLAEATGIPVATTQAGGGVLPAEHPQAVGGLGVTGSGAANTLAAQADLILGVGTRYSDFTTASHSLFSDPQVRIVNINVAPVEAAKLGCDLALVADARTALTALAGRLAGQRPDPAQVQRVAQEKRRWDNEIDKACARRGNNPPGQPEILGALHRALTPRDVIVAAAGSLPGDLQKLWRPADALGYHVEYGYSCMGYEIAGGLGAKRGLLAAGDDREVVVLVGDGSYQMLHGELATAVAEGIRLIVVLIDNAGHASIGGLSERIGSQRYGTDYSSIDLAANAASYGAAVTDLRASPDPVSGLADAVDEARKTHGPTVIVLRSDPSITAPDNGAWWDVPVAEVSRDRATMAARTEYEQQCLQRQVLLGPPGGPR